MVDTLAIPYDRAINVPNARLLGNDTGSTAPAKAMTQAEVLTFLGLSGGSGDVVGPSSATDNAIARFDMATGKLLQDSAVTVEDGGIVESRNAYTSSTNFEVLRLKPATTEYQIGSAIGSAGGTTRHTKLGFWDSAGTFSTAVDIGDDKVNSVWLNNDYARWYGSTSGYNVYLVSRYGTEITNGNGGLVISRGLKLGDNNYTPGINQGTRSSIYTDSRALNAGTQPTYSGWLVGKYGGGYAVSTNRHHGKGWSVWCGQGATPTDTNADGGNAGDFEVWLNSGGAGAGTGAAGADGRFKIIDDATDTVTFSIDKAGNVYADNLPTSDPAVAGQLWNDTGTVKVSAG